MTWINGQTKRKHNLKHGKNQTLMVKAGPNNKQTNLMNILKINQKAHLMNMIMNLKQILILNLMMKSFLKQQHKKNDDI